MLASHLRLDLVELAGRASSLEERLRHALAGGATLPGEAGQRQRWLAVLGDESALERRLAMSGWTSGRALRDQDLASPDLSGAVLPPWARRLEKMLEVTQRELSGEFSDASRPLPFEEFHLAWAGQFLTELSERVDLGRLHSQARRSIARYLANLLCEQATPVLVKEFRLFLADRDILCALDPESGATSRQHYDAFLVEMRAGRLSQIFHNYPVLARRLGEEFERQLGAVSEFLNRLEADVRQLTEVFGVDCAVVEDIRFGSGDRHHDGRSVTCVYFRGGARLIYKPRSLAKEAGLGELAEEITAGLELSLKSLRTLLRPDYGWMEFAPHASCGDLGAVERCYQRLGMLVALVHALRGDDCHAENLVVNGEFPYLIDAESFGQGSARARPRDEAGVNLLHELEDSVITTGFLPIWIPLGGGQAYDAGGLTARGGCEMPVHQLTWQYINSDGMTPARLPRLTPHGGNAVLLGEQPTEISDFLPFFLKGFEQVYLRLLERPPSLAKVLDGPARFIPRPTRVYHNLLLSSQQADFLRDGLELSFHMEQLARSYLENWTCLPDWFWALEIDQLQRGDVPYFCLDSHQLSPAGCPEPLLAQSGAQVVERQMASLTAQKLSQQLDILSLVWRDIRKTPTAPLACCAQVPEPGEFLQAACRIRDWFEAEAVADPEGAGFRWRTVLAAPQETRLWPAQTLPDLYAGGLGVAIFLGACRSRELAVEVLSAIERAFLAHPEGSEPGLFTGSGGWIYAATRLADFLQESELRQRAYQLAALTPGPASQWDVGSGWAGRLLALSRLPEAELGPNLDRLCAAQLEHGGWGEGQALGGFAHGSAGAAVALLRAQAWEPARRALDHQRSLATEVRGLWHDHRPDGSPGLSWCQGSAGVGLAALEACQAGRPEWGEDLLQDALHAILDRPLSPEGSLCCGGMGSVDLLLDAGKVLDRPELIEEARRRAGAWLKLLQEGRWPILRGSGQRLNVGLFQGLAGLGYGMLRLSCPTTYPSVLRFL